MKKQKKFNVHIIRAIIREDNIGSIKTVEACGFVHEATMHDWFYDSKKGWLNAECYYIKK